MEHTNKFQIGQLVKYEISEVDYQECPHCGQEMEVAGATEEVTARVTSIDAHYYATCGVTYVYRLSDGTCFNEFSLKAAEEK